MKWIVIILMNVCAFLIGMYIEFNLIKTPRCSEDQPVSVWDLQTKTLTCFPRPLQYGEGRKSKLM